MLDAIEKRHSIRRYTAEKVFKQDLEVLLRSAMQAPTAMNMQEWRFIAIMNKEDLKKIATFHQYLSPFTNASAGIIVLSDKTKFPDERYNYVDAGICIENILLEAVNVGLGAVVCAVGPDEQKVRSFREYFEIEEDLIPVAAIAIGYPAEERITKERYDSNKVIWR